MKKSIIAVMMAAVTVGAVGGGIATFNASQTDTQLQIAGESEGAQTLPDAEGTDGAAKEAEQDAEKEDAPSPEQEQTATEVAASLPSGSLERTTPSLILRKMSCPRWFPLPIHPYRRCRTGSGAAACSMRASLRAAA